MEKVKEQLKIWADAYYNGNPMVSDEEYDAYCEENGISGGLMGDELSGVIKTYDIPKTMGTLSKCNTEGEFKKWWDSHPNKELVAELKIDGVSTLLEYKKGKLIFQSRGNRAPSRSISLPELK